MVLVAGFTSAAATKMPCAFVLGGSDEGLHAEVIGDVYLGALRNERHQSSTVDELLSSKRSKKQSPNKHLGAIKKHNSEGQTPPRMGVGSPLHIRASTACRFRLRVTVNISGKTKGHGIRAQHMVLVQIDRNLMAPLLAKSNRGTG